MTKSKKKLKINLKIKQNKNKNEKAAVFNELPGANICRSVNGDKYYMAVL